MPGEANPKKDVLQPRKNVSIKETVALYRNKSNDGTEVNKIHRYKPDFQFLFFCQILRLVALLYLVS